eukprot:4010484-Amphidinium_carterae.1
MFVPFTRATATILSNRTGDIAELCRVGQFLSFRLVGIKTVGAHTVAAERLKSSRIENMTK